MNKYQDALNKIVKSCCPNCIDENGCSSCDIEKVCNALAKDWVDSLQELVDKETPKEVINRKAKLSEEKLHLLVLNDYRCPVCNRDTIFGYRCNYCRHCGQKLDWGEEDGK